MKQRLHTFLIQGVNRVKILFISTHINILSFWAVHLFKLEVTIFGRETDCAFGTTFMLFLYEMATKQGINYVCHFDCNIRNHISKITKIRLQIPGPFIYAYLSFKLCPFSLNVAINITNID